MPTPLASTQYKSRQGPPRWSQAIPANSELPVARSKDSLKICPTKLSPRDFWYMEPPKSAQYPRRGASRPGPPATAPASKQGKGEITSSFFLRESKAVEKPPSPPPGDLQTGLGSTSADGSARVSALLLIAAWWSAAGCLGFMVPAFRQALAFSLLVLGILVAVIGRANSVGEVWQRILVGVTALAAFLVGSLGGGELGRAWSLPVAAGCLALTARDPQDRALLYAVLVGIGIGNIYLTGLYAWPIFWHIMNFFATAWGGLGGALAGVPLSVGPTFAAFELPLVTAVVTICWFWWRQAKVVHLLGMAVPIVFFHTAYLGFLARVPELLAKLPPVPPLVPLEEYTPPPWRWSAALRAVLPWNLPIAAALGHLGILWVGLRICSALGVERLRGEATEGQMPSAGPAPGAHLAKLGSTGQLGPLSRLVAVTLKGPSLSGPSPPRFSWGGWLGVFLIAIALFQPLRHTPEGITVVAWKGGFLNPEVAESSDALELGSWGGLPLLFSGWGSRFFFSENLSPEDLRQAHIVLVVHPDKPWPEDQVRRLHEYLARGGRMLFIGGYHFRDGERASQFHQVLAPLRLEIPFETTVLPGRAREQALTSAYHPALLGQGKIIGKPPWGDGASLRLSWGWQPLVWARWGWGDPGTDALLTGTARWAPGERLGDLVLAAEGRFGKGRVIVWANPEIVTDHNLMRHYPLLGRLVSYLSYDLSPPGKGWRGILLGLGLLSLAAAFLNLAPLVVWELAVGIFLAITLIHQVNRQSQPTYVPDGRLHPQWNNVVAIDLGHLNHGNLNPWSPDGWGAFQLLLLRCGFLPIGVESISGEVVSRAGILLTVAPQRAFSSHEEAAVRKFLEAGGTFIALVGADRSAAIRPFLRQLGLDPGEFPVPVGVAEPEPEPMGCIHTFYRADSVEYDSEVLFYAAWPVRCDPTDHLIRGKYNLPVAALRPFGRGRVILFGDSDFILNTNLEFTRQPIDGRQINQAFWRWLLSWLTPQPDWAPPPAPGRMPNAQPPPEATPDKPPSARLPGVPSPD
jgi:hypothetical protein